MSPEHQVASVAVRVIGIEPLSSLSAAHREIAVQHGWWPAENEIEDFRVYWTTEGTALIAPWNSDIRAGLEVVAEGSIRGAFSVPLEERSEDQTTAVGRAQTLVPVER